MSQAVIENPVLGSPYQEPARHFKFADEVIINETVEFCRIDLFSSDR